MRRYAIVVEDAGTNLAAYVPDLPGCVATGETQEEVCRLIREAIELHLEGLEEDGLPYPRALVPADVVRLRGSHPSRATGPKRTGWRGSWNHESDGSHESEEEKENNKDLGLLATLGAHGKRDRTRTVSTGRPSQFVRFVVNLPFRQFQCDQELRQLRRRDERGRSSIRFLFLCESAQMSLRCLRKRGSATRVRSACPCVDRYGPELFDSIASSYHGLVGEHTMDSCTARRRGDHARP